MDIKDLIRKGLEAGGYSGLFDTDGYEDERCCCSMIDLFHCAEDHHACYHACEAGYAYFFTEDGGIVDFIARYHVFDKKVTKQEAQQYHEIHCDGADSMGDDECDDFICPHYCVTD